MADIRPVVPPQATPLPPAPAVKPPGGSDSPSRRPSLFKAHVRYEAQEADDDSDAAEVFPEPIPGRIRIGPDVISPEALDSVADLAEHIKLDESLSSKRLHKMMDDIRDTQSVSKEDFADFEKFVRAMRSWHRELHVQFRDGDYQDKKVDANLLQVHQFLYQWDGARERYRVQFRSGELSRISEGSPSFNPTTAGFYSFAQISQRDMKETLTLMDGLAKGDSPLLSGGNATQMLTRDEIWQTKMKLLDEAIANGKAGRPTEIDVQYYELTSHSMLKKLVDAARAGNKLRVNMDPGRVSTDRDGYMYASEIARKLQTAYRLMDAADDGADVALTLFPVEREIGSENLMHQKLFRVGEKVILGGMNANSQSGENVDAAALVQGPGARQLVDVFKRDTELSKAAKLKDIFDPEKAALMSAGGMWVGPSALVALLLNAAGPQFRGVDAPDLKVDGETLDMLAKEAGTRIDLVVDCEDANEDGSVTGIDLEEFIKKGDTPSNVLELKRDGGRLLARQVKEVIDRLDDADNVERAGDVTDPQGAEQGRETLAVGDEPEQRIAVLLHAITTAEKFIYIPSFVMTRVVASAIAARYNELKAQGKDLDVKVVLDPGIYPDGGTPNEPGYLALEDAGIPVRWAMLTRTDRTHARKVHAKEIVTEKMALLGSTNMSSKGLMSNWELSGLVHFDLDSPSSVTQRDHLVQDFMKTWDNESIRIDTKQVAADRLSDKQLADLPARIEESRHRVVFEAIHVLHNYEMQSAKVVAELLASHPELDAEIKRLVGQGMTRGYATLITLQEKLGADVLRKALDATDAAQKLHELSSGHFLAVADDADATPSGTESVEI